MVNNTVSSERKGNKKSDARAGIYHLNVGENRGIVKHMSFDKTDIQYIREANFFRNGVDGLSQIGAVYNVTVEMIGNTIFYPGMHVYIDPVGIGGRQFQPTVRHSVARKLGFGGYHVITKVTSTITPSGFKTVIVAQWDYSGGKGSAFKSGVKLLSKEKPKKKRGAECGKRKIEAITNDIKKLAEQSGGGS